ncbi:GxxExxY protein [soil metagenome]
MNEVKNDLRKLGKEELDNLSRKVIGACIEVHKAMGPGLLEKVYECCLMKEFQLMAIKAQSQVSIPLIYKGCELNRNYSIDILVEEEIILELKSVENMIPIFDAQIISYLKLADKRLGFLVNFNVPLAKAGIKRFVNNF